VAGQGRRHAARPRGW